MRKPPLVNWSIALSFAVSSSQSELTARLPSAFSMLILAVGVWALATRGLGSRVGLLAGVMVLTQVAMVEKGRLAEIEPIYVCFSGLALAAWCALWFTPSSRWEIWLWVGLFNGLALLAKGPMHLLLFYLVVCCVTARNGPTGWRALLSWSHLAGLLLALGIFAGWAIPYRQLMGAAAEQVAFRQSIGRVTGSEFHWGTWLSAIPRGVSNHLPWLLGAAFWYVPAMRRELRGRESALFLGMRDAVFVGGGLLLLIPGLLPRYLQPLGVPVALLGALAFLRLPLRSSLVVGKWLAAAGGVAFVVALIATVVAVRTASDPHDIPGFMANDFSDAVIWGVGFAAFAITICGFAAMTQKGSGTPIVGGVLLFSGFCALGLCVWFSGLAVSSAPRSRVRLGADTILRRIEPNSTVVAYNVDDSPPLLAILFEIRKTPDLKIAYAPATADVPPGSRWFLVRTRSVKDLRAKFPRLEEVCRAWLDSEKRDAAVLLYEPHMPLFEAGRPSQ
jgi:4-amino-4-deoxy-L-arabinose transferase-like glycosyltransferase